MQILAEERIEKTKKLLDSISLAGKLRVLEIGPGKEGLFINYLPKDFEKCSVDIVERRFPRVDSKIADMNKDSIPFPDNYFDLIICCEVIEHLWNPDNILLQINKKLKKGGNLVLSTPNLTSFVSRISVLFGRYPGVQGQGISLAKNPGSHIRCYNVQTLKYLFDLYGLKTEKVIGASSGLFVRKLIEWYPTMATYIIFLAKKEREAEPVEPLG